MDCPTPAKQLFDTSKQARAQIKRLSAPSKGQPKPYRCVCGYWHLTTMPSKLARQHGKARRRAAA